jgi:hypothetical protein
LKALDAALADVPLPERNDDSQAALHISCMVRPAFAM